MAMNQDSFHRLLDDLQAEGTELASVLAGIADRDWGSKTPAPGWTIHDQVVHLTFFDRMARLALLRPDEFRTQSCARTAAGPDWIDRISIDRRAIPPGQLLADFTSDRSALLDTLSEVDPGYRSPWFGPSMSAASSASARLMETWAHSQDVHDALVISRVPTERVRHVCHLGVLTRSYSFRINSRPDPLEPVRVELRSPAGQRWVWGPEAAAHRVTGTAWDFGLVVTQRRRLAQTNLAATVGPATDWLLIAQAFAG